MIRKITPFIIVIFSLAVIGSVQGASYYVDFWTSNSTKSTGTFTTDLPSFIENNTNTCTMTMESKVNLSATGSNDVILTFRSPGNTVLSSTTRNDKNAYTCDTFGFGIVTSPGSNNTYETRTNLQSPTTNPGYWSTSANYNCVVGNEVQIISDRNVLDSKAYIPNVFGGTIIAANKESNDSLRGYGDCSTIRQFNATAIQRHVGFGFGGGQAASAFYIYPFNSSYSGNVTLTLDTTEGSFHSQSQIALSVDFVKYPSLTRTNIFLSNRTNFGSLIDNVTNTVLFNNTEFTLTANSMYFLVVHWKNFGDSAGANTSFVWEPKYVEMKINTLQPNYDCTAYSECLNNSQFRTCTDTSGNGFPQINEFRACFVTGVFQELTLGFETANGTAFSTLECKKNAITCIATPQSLTLEIPDGWKAVYPETNNSGVMTPHEAMAFLTTEDPYAGFKSLEMNYYPPMRDTVTSGGVSGAATCQNATIAGFIPSVFTNNLTATMVSESFAFPPTNPAISWAAKRATSPRLKTDGCLFDAFTPQCYTEFGCNSTTLPTGKYMVDLLELDISGQSTVNALTFSMTAPTDWQLFTSDLNRSALNASAKYRLAISLDDSDVFTQIPNRVFFDEFKIISLASPLIANCTTACDPLNPTNLVIATESNGICTTETIINESTCFEAFEDTQEERAETRPFDSLYNQSFLDRSLGLPAGGIVGFLLSPFFLYMGFFIFLGVGIELLLVRSGGNASGTIFIVVMVFGAVSGGAVTIGTGITVVPLWFTAIFIVIAGFLGYNAYSKMSNKSGGG